ncbi:hypothetical protein SCA03_40500 [Streptomyces cacaoi]|uniref:Uncharacterized protein n=1 Tax=Streptomyces cacaoi TaxID=1898 RepID=A0A4Y3R2H7_STRCI|nr:hypothetical protein SCA03_40500 [Streptomyces cacaoi]
MAAGIGRPFRWVPVGRGAGGARADMCASHRNRRLGPLLSQVGNDRGSVPAVTPVTTAGARGSSPACAVCHALARTRPPAAPTFARTGHPAFARSVHPTFGRTGRPRLRPDRRHSAFGRTGPGRSGRAVNTIVMVHTVPAVGVTAVVGAAGTADRWGGQARRSSTWASPSR